MNYNDPNVITTQGQRRFYTQRSGPKPTNRVRYSGVDEQFLIMGTFALPQGEITRIQVPDPSRQQQFLTVGSSIAPAEYATGSFLIREKHDSLTWLIHDQSCELNVYEVNGKCGDLSDILNGWTDYVMIYSQGRVTNIESNERGAWDDDAPTEYTATVTWQGGVYQAGRLGLGEVGATVVAAEIQDIIYGDKALCGNCGPENDGTKYLYAVTRGDGAAVAPTVVYSVDYGATWTALAITGIAATDQAVAIRLMSGRLVVFTEEAGGAAGGYFHTLVNAKTGVPASAWSVVSSGFIATATSRMADVYVRNAMTAFIVGTNGYIQRVESVGDGATTLSAGGITANNLLRIDGVNDAIYITGATGTVLKSTNASHDAPTFSIITAAVTGTPSVTAVEVLSNDYFWIGTADGNLYSSQDGGETLRASTFSGSGTATTTINDIKFATMEVGYFSATESGPVSNVYATFTAGTRWDENGSRLTGLTVEDRFNRLAVPVAGTVSVKANNLAIAGLESAGTDGYIALGIASVV